MLSPPFYWEDPEAGLANNSPLSPDRLSPCFPAQEQSSLWGQDHRVKVPVTWGKQAWGNFALKSQAPNTLVASNGGRGRIV